MQTELVDALMQLLRTGGRGALATVVRVAGSVPQRPGARMLLRPDGTCVGTVGGGAIEQAVLDALRACQAGAEAQLLVRELGYELGMCCGGRMEVFVEPIASSPRLIICGAGHIAQEVAALAKRIGFSLLILDEREELNVEARFPGAQRELSCPESWLRRSPLAENDWLLITTHDHALDERILERALTQAACYIGLVGSERKVLRLLERIRARRGEQSLAKLHAPVGVALNALGPQEIAVSIVAELIALRRGAKVAHMRVLDDARLARVLELRRVEKP